MYRDFSNRSQNELRRLVFEVESEKLFDFTDSIGDSWYIIESWIGKLNIKNYLNNVNDYHKKVIDKNDAIQSSINTIFRKVKSVDTSYKNTLSGKKSQLQQWQRYIDEMSQIVNPRNGKFNARAMSDALDDLLKQLSIGELNSSLEEYVELDKTTQKYTYQWNKIEELLSRPKDELTETEYLTLVAILNTMVYDNGYIDIESLQHFVNLGYTTPSAVTKDDLHISFDHVQLPNGSHNYHYYNYLQNKAYLNETFLTTVILYDAIFQNEISDNSSNNFNDLLKLIVNNYSVIEWRMRLNVYDDIKTKYWSGETYVEEDTLNYFNNSCVPQINIQYCNDTSEDGMMYYLIYSNAYDNGVDTASPSPYGGIRKDGIEHQDSTIRLYVNCVGNASADSRMVNLQSVSELSSFYQEYDLASSIAKKLIEFAVGLIPGGEYINGIINIANSNEAIEQINGSLNLIKKADLEELTEETNAEISSKGEKIIDGGIDLADKAAGIYVDYKKAELNNKKVEICKKAVDDLHNDLSNLKKLGIYYDSVIVRYDEYDKNKNYDRDWKSYAENKKNSNKISEISFMNYFSDDNLLLSQYNIVKVNNYEEKIDASSEEFLKLKKEVEEYIATGNLEEGSYLIKYMNRW